MALTCDMTECKIPAAEQQMQAYAFACMLIGLEGITEKNYKQWYIRYSYADTLNGPFFPTVSFTLAEVKRRIGLKCNVAKESDAHFTKKCMQIYSERLTRELKLNEEEIDAHKGRNYYCW